jgi:hypothetical protein
MRLAAVERLDELLLTVPGLVDNLLGDDPLTGERIAEWLLEIERQLTALGMPAAASFASLRGRLWSVGRGLRLPGLQLTKTQSARNWRQVGVSAILDEATRTLEGLLAPSRAAVEEARAALRQAIELGRIREQLGGRSLPWRYPSELWSALLGDGDLTVLATRAAGLIGEVDARTLLEREALEDSEAL